MSEFIPPNKKELKMAADPLQAAFEDPNFIPPENLEELPLLYEVYVESLCVGCTNPESKNYSIYAEVDDNSCI